MRIAIVRALHLGDMLCAVPALRALRAKYPDAHVTLIGLAWAQELVPHLSRFVDTFEEFPGFYGIPERDASPRRSVDFLRAMQERHFDLAVQLHGSGSHINEFVALLGARELALFHERGRIPQGDGCFVEWPHSGREADRLLTLTRALGCPDQAPVPELEVRPVDRAALTASAPFTQLDGQRYVCMHPGARFATRRWAPDRFAAVADTLIERGFSVAVTGTQAEAPITAAVRGAMRAPSIDFTGALSLGAFAALVADAALVVCNDTGTSHVAAAVRTPSVVVASGSDVARWAPHDAQLHRVLWHDVPCRPCMYEHCPTNHECAAGVSVDDARAAADALLAAGVVHA